MADIRLPGLGATYKQEYLNSVKLIKPGGYQIDVVLMLRGLCKQPKISACTPQGSKVETKGQPTIAKQALHLANQ